MDPTSVHARPAGLPVPVDDGAADHLPGTVLPAVALPSTAGGTVRLDRATASRAVLFSNIYEVRWA